MNKQPDDGLKAAIAAVGNRNESGRRLGMSTSIYEWRRVPADRIRQVEAVTGVRRERLRPDLYD